MTVLSRRRVLAAVAGVVTLVAALIVVDAVLVPHSGAATGSHPRRASAEAASPSPTVRHPTTVVTIGDSIMAGLGLDQGQAWPDLIAAQDGVTVRNLGCNGAGFVAIGACGTDFSGLVAEAATDRPQLVIIEASDNDLGQDDAELAAATTSTLASLHAAIPGATIVGFSTLWDQPMDAPAEITTSSADLRNALANIGGMYIDLGQPLRGNADLLQADDEHPTAAGQQVLSLTVRIALSDAGIEI